MESVTQHESITPYKILLAEKDGGIRMQTGTKGPIPNNIYASRFGQVMGEISSQKKKPSHRREKPVFRRMKEEKGQA
jgi:hypothetical protein